MIGSKIHNVRESKWISRAQLSRKLHRRGINLDAEVIRRIESGERTISADELKVICEILDIDIDSLFDKTSDLVTYFKGIGYPEEALKEIEQLQDVIKIFTYQKKIYYGKYKTPNRKPLWQE